MKDNPRAASTRGFLLAASREIGVFLFFTALACAATWPLVAHPSRAVADQGDPYLNIWILDWVQRAAIERLDVWDAPMFHPARMVLAFSENLLGVAWPLLPLRSLVSNPILLYNIAFLLSFAMSGYGGFVLARMVSGSWLAGFVGGVFFALLPWRFDHLSHLQHLWAAWLPLLLASILRYLRRPGWSSAILFAGAFVMNGLTNMHWFAFGSIAAGFALVAGAVSEGRWRSLRFWIPIGSAGILALVSLYPVIDGYSNASELYKEVSRSPADIRSFSAEWKDWLAPAERNKLYGDHSAARNRAPERALFPGILALLFSWIALRPREPAGRRGSLNGLLEAGAIGLLVWAWLSVSVEASPNGEMLLRFRMPLVFAASIVILIRVLRRSNGPPLAERMTLPLRLAMLWIVLGVLGSFGSKGVVYSLLSELLDPLRGIRVPARFAMIAYTGLAITAATGARYVAERFRHVRLAGFAIVVLFLFELNAAPIRWFLHEGRWTPAYAWLKEAPLRGAVIELPIRHSLDSLKYVLNSTRHHKSIVNGHSSFDPEHHRQVVAWAASAPVDPKLIPYLEKIGTSMIVVHGDALEYDSREPVRQWLRQELRAGRLTFVRRFDEGIHGVWTFAPTGNEPLAAWWRETGVDPAGHSPVESLSRFLDARLNWSDLPMGHVSWETDRDGTMRIWGWGAAPSGIQTVLLHFDNERISLPARFVPRGDVERLMPWMAGKSTGFELHLNSRPAGVHLDTDLVVQIVAKDGSSARLDQILFRWK
ncbi:MAG TPA: hypothetical protein VM557_03800 [Thermoanaerobaculia bacterium]|nr:hypothetical protein [Thermoanaerobaculia bacterium]